MGIVSTIEGKCKACYSCIRNCPVKAIKVDDGQSKVLEERCINCGECVKVCAQSAKKVYSFNDEIKVWLAKGQKVIAMLAPSFPASFYPTEPKDIQRGLKELGFAEVVEVTNGVELTVPEYKKLLAKRRGTVIATHCPAVVFLVEKYYPELVPYLAPIDSAMMATGKMLRSKYPGAKLVFIGPCIAKKEEVLRFRDLGIINAALTFRELKAMFERSKIELPRESKGHPSGPDILPRLFPLPGGLVKNLYPGDQPLQKEVLVVEGKEDCLNTLESLRKGHIKPDFVDMLFCKGCIDGPEIDSEIDIYSRRYVIFDYSQKNPGRPLVKDPDLDLTRNYSPNPIEKPMPTESEIKAILRYTYKNKTEDELNCGACGYNTCRDKAIAVFQGIAEIDMCLPYLLQKSRGELEYYKSKVADPGLPDPLDSFVGDSEIIRQLKSLMVRANKSDSTILLQGESGVGKEVIARTIHMMSSRKKGPFIAVNCAAVPELLLESELFGYEEGAFTGARKGGKPGKFEQAHGGTLLLDEIGDMPVDMQVKLLRVLQEREVERVGGTKPKKIDVRIISSTNKNLKQLVQEGKFRIDLYYRLQVFTLNVPSLREHKEDIPVLLGHLMSKISRNKNISPKIFADETMDILMAYDWPGNVREMENVIERCLIVADSSIIFPADLPAHIREKAPKPLISEKASITEVKPLKEALSEVEKDLIMAALEKSGHNKVQAAHMLGIPRATLYIKLKEYSIK